MFKPLVHLGHALELAENAIRHRQFPAQRLALRFNAIAENKLMSGDPSLIRNGLEEISDLLKTSDAYGTPQERMRIFKSSRAFDLAETASLEQSEFQERIKGLHRLSSSMGVASINIYRNVGTAVIAQQSAARILERSRTKDVLEAARSVMKLCTS